MSESMARDPSEIPWNPRTHGAAGVTMGGKGRATGASGRTLATLHDCRILPSFQPLTRLHPLYGEHTRRVPMASFRARMRSHLPHSGWER